MNIFRISIITTMALIVMLWTGPGCGRCTVVANDTQPENKVRELIERLGSDSYATRVRAREQLQRLGLEAFDELRAAQEHEDSEIAAAASFLVSSLLVSWSKETDPPEVRDALNEYGARDPDERSSRIHLLAELPSRKGLAALVRLTRFETDLRLSRQAAISLMQQTMSEDPGVRVRHAETIRQVLLGNNGQAADWLRTYADDLSSGTYSAENWTELVKKQRREIDAAISEDATRASVLELIRVCAQRAALLGQRKESMNLAVDNIDLIPPRTRDLVDACSWAIDNELHEFVLELRKAHRRMFDQHANLLYGAAEATKVGGDSEGAESIAQQAIAIRSFPKTEVEKEKLSESALAEISQAHREVAEELRSRGLFEWSEREYRLIIRETELASLIGADTRALLAEMLGELLRHDEVVAVLEPLSERIEKDRDFQNNLRVNGFSWNKIRSLMEFHRGLASQKANDLKTAKESLMSAWQLYTRNIDILIAMHRLDSDDEWKQEVLELLGREVRSAQSNVQTTESLLQQRGASGINKSSLAQALNNYAWLVCNTEGDYQQALRYSLRSLELMPNHDAYTDTCARCYFALKRYDEAIKMQRRAVRMAPHSPPITRQLKEFERAKEEAAGKTEGE